MFGEREYLVGDGGGWGWCCRIRPFLPENNSFLFLDVMMTPPVMAAQSPQNQCHKKKTTSLFFSAVIVKVSG